MAPKSISIFKQKEENKTGGYYLSFMKPNNTVFSKVLVNITGTDDKLSTKLNYTLHGKY